MYTQVGNCPKCGAPIYVPTNWNGLTPPLPMYTCNCRYECQPTIQVIPYPSSPYYPVDTSGWPTWRSDFVYGGMTYYV